MVLDLCFEARDIDQKSTDQFKEVVKKELVKKTAKMKLLIVVDKLLTGFGEQA